MAKIIKYRKKPIIVEAIEYDGTNEQEIIKFAKNKVKMQKYEFCKSILYIETLEGNMKISKGDIVVKGVAGEFYPCKPDIFKKTYEKVKG